MYFDTHIHLNSEKYEDDFDEAFEEMLKSNVKYFVCPGYDLESSKKAVELAEKHNEVFALVGIHPSEASKYDKKELKVIEELAKHKKVVGIGEIGLDYYWTKENKEEQKELLIKQIKLANKLDLPIALHIREATIDILNILEEYDEKRKGIFHCVPLNEHLIKEGLKLGYYISFSGNITFQNAKPVDSIKLVPLDKILVETDGPYLTPHPHRGKRNSSKYLKYIVEKIAEVKEIDKEELKEILMINSKKIYGVKDE